MDLLSWPLPKKNYKQFLKIIFFLQTAQTFKGTKKYLCMVNLLKVNRMYFLIIT